MSQLCKIVYMSVNCQSWTCGVLIAAGASADLHIIFFSIVTCLEMNEQKPKF